MHFQEAALVQIHALFVPVCVGVAPIFVLALGNGRVLIPLVGVVCAVVVHQVGRVGGEEDVVSAGVAGVEGAGCDGGG